MNTRMLDRYVVLCLAAIVMWTPLTEAQNTPLHVGVPGTGSYLGAGFHPYPRSYGIAPPGGYYHGFFMVPRPPVGIYVPGPVMPPPPVYVFPPAGIAPLPYPYFYYQPPVYGFGPYIQPYYPPRPIHPYAVRPFGYPRADRRYRERMEQRRDVAPMDEVVSPQEDVEPLPETPLSPPPVEPNQP